MSIALEEEFDRAMARSGPFAASTRFAVAVSGGADSTALALLMHNWLAQRQGSMLALIVDHGLRAASRDEAELTRERLAARGIASQILTLAGIAGSGLQANARRARHDALQSAAREANALFLLFGHHAADQSETVAMRAKRGGSGLEGMPGWTARDNTVILRPLLSISPGPLRDYLREAKMAWVEDPANQDRRFERVRVRQEGSTTAPKDAEERRRQEVQIARFVARNVIVRPQGFALIRPTSVPPAVLAGLLKIVAGRIYAPRQNSVVRLAAELRLATLGGAQILKAGRFGRGWLLVREPSACKPPGIGRSAILWDGRFKLLDGAIGTIFGAAAASRSVQKYANDLPAVVSKTFPRVGSPVATSSELSAASVVFTPPSPLAPLPFDTLCPAISA